VSSVSMRRGRDRTEWKRSCGWRGVVDVVNVDDDDATAVEVLGV